LNWVFVFTQAFVLQMVAHNFSLSGYGPFVFSVSLAVVDENLGLLLVSVVNSHASSADQVPNSLVL